MEPTTAFFATETTRGQTSEASPSHASQATSDDDLSPTDAPSMFSTSMAPPKTSHVPDKLETVNTPYAAAVSVKSEESLPTTKLPEFDISDFGTEKADDEAKVRGDVVREELTTTAPTATEEPVEELEDKSIIEVRTILPDVLLSASLSTKPMFAVGKTEESILVDITTDKSFITVLEPEASLVTLANTVESGDKSESTSLSESITESDHDKLPTQNLTHSASETSTGKDEAESQSSFSLATEATFLESAKSTVFSEYEDETGVGVVMADPPPLSTQRSTSSEAELLETSSGVTVTGSTVTSMVFMQSSQPRETSTGTSKSTQKVSQTFPSYSESEIVELTDHVTKSPSFTTSSSATVAAGAAKTTPSITDHETSHEEAASRPSEAPKETLTEAMHTTTYSDDLVNQSLIHYGEQRPHIPQIPEIPDDRETVVSSGDFLSSPDMSMTPTVSFINGKLEVTLHPKDVAEEVRGDTFGSDSLGENNLSEQTETTFEFDSSLVEAGKTPHESLVSESSMMSPLFSTTLDPEIDFGLGGLVVESTPSSPPIAICEEEMLISEGTVIPSISPSITEKQPFAKAVHPAVSTNIPLDQDDTTKSSISLSVHSTSSITKDKDKDTAATTQVMGMTTQKDVLTKTTTSTDVSALESTSGHMDHLDTYEAGVSVQTPEVFTLTLPTQVPSTTTSKLDITFTLRPSSSETVKMQKEAASQSMILSTKNLEMTTAKDELSPSHFSSESEASGDETSYMFSTTTISSALNTMTKSVQELNKTTKTISVSSSTDTEPTRDQRTEIHSREPVSSPDSTSSSTIHTFSTRESTGRTFTSQDITSHTATNTASVVEDKEVSAKPPESTVIDVSGTLFSSTEHLDEKLAESTLTLTSEKTTAKNVLSPSSSLYTTSKSYQELTKTASDTTETTTVPSTSDAEIRRDETTVAHKEHVSSLDSTKTSTVHIFTPLSTGDSTEKTFTSQDITSKKSTASVKEVLHPSSTDAEATRDQTIEAQSREPLSSLDFTVTSTAHTFTSLSTGYLMGPTVISKDITSNTATTTATVIEDKVLSAKPSESTVIDVSEFLFSSTKTEYMDEKSHETTTISQKTTAKEALTQSNFFSSLPLTESEASGDETSEMISKDFTTSSSLHTTIKSDETTETISMSTSSDAVVRQDQTTETHSREPVSSLDSTETSTAHTLTSLSTEQSTGRTVISEGITSHTATTTASVIEDKELSAKPSESTIIDVSETLFSSAQTEHLDKTLSESTVTMTSEKTTAKDLLSPSSFFSSLPSAESEASGYDTSDMFSKDFTTSSSLHTTRKSDDLIKTPSDTTETISVSTSSDAVVRQDQTTEAHSREPVSSLDSTVTSTAHTLTSLSTEHSTGRTVISEGITSHTATTTVTVMEDKELSAKPSESTIIDVSKTLLSSAQTEHLDKILSVSTVTMTSEMTTAKDALSPSSFFSSLPSTESEASGDETSEMISKDFTTSSSLHTTVKSDETTETISVSTSSDAVVTQDQTTEAHSREPVSSLDSTETSTAHTLTSLSTEHSTEQTVTSQDVTSHPATTTATIMEERELSAKPSESTIIDVSETLFSSAQTEQLDKTLSESTLTMTSEKTTAKDVLSPSSFFSSLPLTESEASGDETSDMFSKDFTTSSSLHTTRKSDEDLTKTPSETISVSTSSDVVVTQDQTTEAHSREHVSSLDSTVTSTAHTLTSLSTEQSTGGTVISEGITSHTATTTVTVIEDKELSAKPSESTIIDVSKTLLSSAQTEHLDKILSESTVTMTSEMTTAKDILSPSSFFSSLPSTESEASGDDTSDMFSKEFTTTSSLYTTSKSDKELAKTTGTISLSSSTDTVATREQTTETHSSEPVSTLDSTVTNTVHTLTSLSTEHSTGRTVISEGITSHTATTTASVMEDKELSAKPSESTIIDVSKTLLSSTQTEHLDKILSVSTVTITSEMTTAKDALSPSSFFSSLPLTESDASGDETSEMISKDFTTSSSLHTTIKSDETTETISMSTSSDVVVTQDQTTEAHSREPVSSLDSTETSTAHTLTSLSTEHSIGRTVTSQDVTSHPATTTATIMEEREMSAKPSESTIIDISETLFSSAQTELLDKTLSESTVTMTSEKTTAKDLLSPSSFFSSLPLTESEASGDDTSDMFSKEFTTTSSLYITSKSDKDLAKTTGTISLSSSTDTAATRDQTTEMHSSEPVSTLDSTVTNTVHTLTSLSTGISTGRTVTSQDVTSHSAITTATVMEERVLSAKPSESTIIDVSETLFSSAQTEQLDKTLSESTATLTSEITTAKDLLSPSGIFSSLPLTESEASGDDTSDMFSKDFSTTSSSLHTTRKSDEDLTKKTSETTEKISESTSSDAEVRQDQTTEAHSREPVSSLDSTETSTVHTLTSLSTEHSTGRTVISEGITSHTATTTASVMEEKELSAKPSESTIIDVSKTLLSSAQTEHLDKILSESTVTMTSVMTTAKDVLSPSGIFSSLPSAESEASGGDTSDMFSKDFTTSSSLHTTRKSDDLIKTPSDTTETISVSTSSDAVVTQDQTTEAHSREPVSSLDSTVTSTAHTLTSLSTEHSTGRTVISEGITSHTATTTVTVMEDKELSAKPSESTIIDVSKTLLSSAQTEHLDKILSVSTVTMTSEMTTTKDALSLSSFFSSLPSTVSEASGDDTSDMFRKEFTTTSSLYTTSKLDKELTKTTGTISLSSSTDTVATREQTTETHSSEPVSTLDSTVTNTVHTLTSLSTGISTGRTVTSQDVTSHSAITTATVMEERVLSAKPSESTVIEVSETLFSLTNTAYTDEKTHESTTTSQKTTTKEALRQSNYSSSLPLTESEASGDDTSEIFSKDFTTSSSLQTTRKSDKDLIKTPSETTETISASTLSDVVVTQDQTTEAHSREPVSSLDSTEISTGHTLTSMSTEHPTGITVTSHDVTSHTATTTVTVMEDEELSSKPSESTIIDVSETLFSSAQTEHLEEKLSESTVAITSEKTTALKLLSPNSPLYTTSKSDQELPKTTGTISLSSSSDTAATRDQTTETHSREPVSTLDSSLTSTVHTFTALNTGISTGRTVTSQDVTSHRATTTATVIEDKELSAKPSESTIFDETLFSSAQTEHLDKILSESTVTMTSEMTTAKDVLSPSHVFSSLPSTESETSGDDTSDIFSKEFVTSSFYITSKSDQELTKTTILVSSSSDAVATRDQTTEAHSGEPVSTLDSTVTSTMHTFTSLSTVDSKGQTVSTEDIMSHKPTPTVTVIEDKELSAKPSESTIIDVSETLFSSAQTEHLDKTLSVSTVTMTSEMTTAKDILSPSSFFSSLPLTESEASGDDTSDMFSKDFSTTSSSLHTTRKSDEDLTKTPSETTETISVSTSSDAEVRQDQTTEAHSREPVSSLDSTETSTVHTLTSLSTEHSTGRTVISDGITSHTATTTVTVIEDKELSAKPSESTIIDVSETLFSSAQTEHLDKTLSESNVTMTSEMTTAKDVLSPSRFFSSLPLTESEASGDGISEIFSKDFTTSISPHTTTKSDEDLTKTPSDTTEKISVSTSSDAVVTQDQKTEAHSREPVSSLDSTITSTAHTLTSLSTEHSTGRTVTSQDVTSHTATTTVTVTEDKELSAKPSESTIIDVSETLFSSAQTEHLDKTLSESTVTMTSEMTTAKDVLSLSSFFSSLPLTESEASGDDTSDMFSKDFSTTSSSLHTTRKSDKDLTKTPSETTETISVSTSSDAEVRQDQTTEAHSGEPVSSLDSTETSTGHTLTSLSTEHSTGRTVISEGITSHTAKTTVTVIEDKELSAKPSESTIIDVSETLFSSAQTEHSDKTLSESTVTMTSEMTTAKDVLSLSRFFSSLPLTESEASGDGISEIFSKDFTTSISPHTTTNSDEDLTKTTSDTTEKISVPTSSDAVVTHDQKTEAHN
ncbi:serine-rich adhesin for platelets-like [Chanodichthys erythropterus]|uniref:serine-rich adhesin for platelets-like n=1 Tax=Chanodichthys erythropterus TaxID=933992 RepID=UPI00351F586B